jgi:hypothetical protein
VRSQFLVMDIKTPITLGMVGAIGIGAIGGAYGLRLFGPPQTLPLVLTALSTGASLSTVALNAVNGRQIEIVAPPRPVARQG